MAQFGELRERIGFVRDQLSLLTTDLQLFENASVEGHFAHSYLGDGWLSNVTWDVFVLQKEPVPVRLRAHAGMIANELRATLDNLACLLAERNGRAPSKTYFPISKSKEIFDDDGRKKMRALSVTDQQIIADLRPYRGGDNLLWGLHEADRRRKHQRLGACAVMGAKMMIDDHLFGGPGIQGARWIEKDTGPQQQPERMWWDPARLSGVEVGRLTQVAGGLPRSWKAKFMFEVAYMDPEELHGKAVGPTLAAFADRVESIVGLFD